MNKIDYKQKAQIMNYRIIDIVKNTGVNSEIYLVDAGWYDLQNLGCDAGSHVSAH